MESTDDPPASQDAVLHHTVQPLDTSDASPTLAKRFSSLNIDSSRTPEKQINGSPRQTASSPRSPMLNRKSSNQSLRPVTRRASSTNYSLKAHAESDSTTTPSIEERPSMTASFVAADHFRRELVKHVSYETSETDTVVITHDACYGHRYARPKTSKSTLSMIVERPERLQAGVLGLSAAYVRLGQRHSGGSHPPHPQREVDGTIPFKIHRTSRSVSLTSLAVTSVHGTKWMQELKTMCDTAEARLASGGKELSRPETPNAISGATPAKPLLHEGDLYLCSQSLQALESALGGVCDGVDAAFEENGLSRSHKKAFVCIRPPGHHCSADLPSGFCWLNNVHVGIEHAAQTHGLTHAAIIDFDLHHGDGSQAITWERNARPVKAAKGATKNAQNRKAAIGYFSLHDINSYPCEDGDIGKIQRASVCLEDAHSQTIWNVHLQPWNTEAEFWKLYETRYLTIIDKARTFLRSHYQRLKSSNGGTQPQGAIFISAGFDASQWEMEAMQRHKVSVPTEFYARFTSDIVKLSQEEGTGVEGRVISVLEGGYSDRALTSGILSHISGLAGRCPPVQSDDITSLPSPLSQKGQVHTSWDTDWWSDSTLRELESLKAPPLPPPPTPLKKPRSTETPTYQSSTQSFTAKVVDPSKMYRSVSGNTALTPPRSRPATPPPPEVGWAVAALELSKLLIPNDRQINSCRHEELNEPKVKRERHSSIGLANAEALGERMQLRGKKGKAGGEAFGDLGDRRRTISELPVPLTDEGNAASAQPQSAAPRPAIKVRQPTAPRADGVKVIKTRRASGTKEDFAKQAGMAPPPPVPSIPKQLPIRSGSSDPRATADNISLSSGSNQTADVDSLTSGVRKITLNLSHPAKEDATTAPKKAVKKPAVPRAPKAGPTKAAAAKASKDVGVVQRPVPEFSPAASRSRNQENGHSAGPATSPTSFGTDGAMDFALANGSTVSADIPLPVAPNAVEPRSPVMPEPPPLAMPEPVIAGSHTNDLQSSTVPLATSSDQPTQPVADGPAPEPTLSSIASSEFNNSDHFIAYHPPGQPMRSAPHTTNTNTNHRSNGNAPAQGQAQGLTWMPTNTNTPVHAAGKKGKENLPNFTAKGVIPFALKQAQAQPQRQDVNRSEMVGKANGYLEAENGDGGAANGGAEEVKHEHESEKGSAGELQSKQQLDRSIWDVPATPQRP